MVKMVKAIIFLNENEAIIKKVKKQFNRLKWKNFEWQIKNTIMLNGKPFYILSVYSPFTLKPSFNKQILELESKITPVDKQILQKQILLLPKKRSKIWYIVMLGAGIILAIVLLKLLVLWNIIKLHDLIKFFGG